MKRIDLKITPLSPLAVGRKKPGSISEAADFISGSVIRGAIAQKMLSLSDFEGDFSQNGGDFQSLFLGEKPAIFHNAYPAKKVLPCTAVSSKTNSGFKSNDKNGVFDTLIDRYCATFHNHPYDPNCPKDGGRVEPFSGFYDDDKSDKNSASKSLLTRVGINRRRNTSEEEILYSLEVINASEQLFYGSIIVENDNLAKSLTEYINKQQFRLGGSVSRGLGKVKIEANLQNITTDLNERVTEFNQKLGDRYKLWNGLLGGQPNNLPSNRCYFTINLDADAIFTDNWLHTTVITPKMLGEWAQLEDSTLKLEVAYSSYDYRSGWNSAWGLMKDVELITNRGGVYLFSTENKSQWIPALEKLELQGVGERTTEGFGKITICHSFHKIFREQPA